MNVDEVLTTAFDEIAPLRRPVLVVALKGWFDAAGAASDAVRLITAGRVAPVVASIDADPFYDFTQERPQVEIDDDQVRHLIWPTNEFRAARTGAGNHDLVLLAGVEPHLRYGTFADCVLAVADALGCEMAITVGATGEASAHTRPPAVVASTTDASLARALSLSPPSYQGPTGLPGVLHERFERASLPAISLRVGVPHYLAGAKHPRCSVALLARLERVLGLDGLFRIERLDDEIEHWQRLHDEATAGDDEATEYVHMLEREYDRRALIERTSGDEIATELERFLRGLRPDDPNPNPDPDPDDIDPDPDDIDDDDPNDEG